MPAQFRVDCVYAKQCKIRKKMSHSRAQGSFGVHTSLSIKNHNKNSPNILQYYTKAYKVAFLPLLFFR